MLALALGLGTPQLGLPALEIDGQALPQWSA